MTTKAYVLFVIVLLLLVGFGGSALAASLVDSPRAQLASGVLAEDILCKENRVLVIRTNGNVACISEKSAEKLGWEIIKLNFVWDVLLEENPVELSDEKLDVQIISELPPNETTNISRSSGGSSSNTNNPVKEVKAQTTNPVEEFTKEISEELILNPKNLTGIIPQDITFDYVLEMPPKDPAAFAQRMADFFDDTIIESSQDERAFSYTTERGWITILKEVSTYGHMSSTFKYTFFGEGRINPSQADVITTSLIEELGISMDGTEIYKEGYDYTDYNHYYIQTKGDLPIYSNILITDFDPGYTVIRFGNWNDNISEMNLYDIDKARENGKQHIFKYPELTGPECDVWFSDLRGTDFDDGLHILHGKPVYQFYAGTCNVSYAVNHSEWFDVFVDAITGEPLYIQNRVTF